MLSTIAPVNPAVYIEAFIKADSNPHLAAERLGVSVTEFMDVISKDTVTIPRLLRTRTLLDLFTLFTTANKELLQAIPLMEPSDLVKAHSSLTSVIEKLTATNQNVTFNFHEHMLSMLPPEAREALALLTAPPPSIINYDSGEDD